MPFSISRATLNELLPPGQFWIYQDQASFEQLLQGIGTNFERVKSQIDDLAFIRAPLLTTILEDLEKEFGIRAATGLTEDERRQSLLATKTARKSDGSASFMEQKLQEAGFDVQVHINNPPVDPDIFVAPTAAAFAYVCGGVGVVCGREDIGNNLDIISGSGKGFLLVNGDPLQLVFSSFLTICGNAASVCGNPNSICGSETGESHVDVEYLIPTDSGYWGLIFFVGGDATRDPITDELTSIDFAQIPASRVAEFKRLILKYKPMHSWAGLVIRFV